MPLDDDNEPQRSKPVHQVGMVLDALSVAELEARISELQVEIERLRAAIKARGSTRAAADAVFKF